MDFLSARTSKPILIASLFSMSLFTKADVLFTESFDDQPDFTSTMHDSTRGGREIWNGAILPEGWDAMFQGTQWSPETGYPDNHASFEILASNADKARGGTGKSMVNWRESYNAGWNNWASDSQLIKYLDKQHDEIYIEFWISFSENWYQRNNDDNFISKIVRIGSFDGVGDPYNGAAGALGPVVFWDYNHNNYGMRNNIAFRGGPWGENYSFDVEAFGLNPQTNYTSDTVGMAVGGENPEVVDQVNGGYLADVDRYDFLSHDRLFGPAGHWTKIALYVKLNSAPGVADGTLMQWINDERIKVTNKVPWIGENVENKMVGWNYVAIGGNDFFRPYPNEKRFEDWYSIDDVSVRNSLPEGLLSGESRVPNPPSSIVVQ